MTESKSRRSVVFTPEQLAPLLEAALFATASPLTLDELVDLTGASKKAVKTAMERLVADYAGRENGALEIGLVDGYILRVRPIFQRIVDRLLPSELPTSTLRTLSYIAASEPILQKDVVEARGSGAYDHIKELVERGLVAKEPSGNSSMLRVGPRFAEYFLLDRDQVEPYLQGLKKEFHPTISIDVKPS